MIFIGNSAIPDNPTTSYANAGGTGDRTASITVTSSITPDAGTLDNLVDGSTVFGSSTAIDMPGVGSTAIADGDYFRYDFGAGTLKYIDEVKIYFDAFFGGTMGIWAIQGSDDASSWTTYGTFTWDADTETVTLSSVSPYGHRYWQMVENDTGQFWKNNWFTEIEFKIAAGAT